VRYLPEHHLEAPRARGRCEYCGAAYPRLQAAHLLARGSGGGSTLNLPLNLVGLCIMCHAASHAGHEPTLLSLLTIVSRRECFPTHRELEAHLRLLIRAPKECKACEWCLGTGIGFPPPPGGTKPYHCVACDGTGILDQFGEPYREQPRRPTWLTQD